MFLYWDFSNKYIFISILNLHKIEIGQTFAEISNGFQRICTLRMYAENVRWECTLKMYAENYVRCNGR